MKKNRRILTMILRRYAIVISLLCTMTSAFTQSYWVKGQIIDAQNEQPLAGATIMLKATTSELKDGQSADESGHFMLIQIIPGKYEITVSFLGYNDYTAQITVTDSHVDMGLIKLTTKDQKLDQVNVSAMMIRQDLQGDTTIYNADAFKVNADASTEDLLKKMPGITVEGSTIKAGGEEVKKVLVDGKEFFGNDPMMAVKNIQADMVDKIEVFDKQSDQAEFTGFYDGNEERTINIATKKGRATGQFGRVYGGYGTDDRYEAGGNINQFNGNRRLSLVGLFNNVNQQNFSMEDITGSLSGQNRRRGGPGGFGEGITGESLDGLSTTKAIGLNYSDLLFNKVEITTSYFYNDTKNTNQSDSYREYFDTNNESHTYNEIYNSESDNYNHRFSMRLIYSIDSLNSIIFTPRLSWQNNTRNSLTEGTDFYDLQESLLSSSLYDTENNGLSVSGNLMFRHKFMKNRRTISVRIGTSSKKTDSQSTSYSLSEYINEQDRDLMTNQFADNDDKSYNVSTDLIYTEPISPRSMIMLNYSPSITYSKGDKSVFDLTLDTEPLTPVASLSNNTTSDYTQQRGGISYNYSSQNFNIVGTVNAQYSELDGEQIYPQQVDTKKSFNSILPSVMVRFKKDRSTNLRMFYHTNTSAPSISQLQDVVDNSNTRVYSSGNPDLKQQYSHNLMFHFNKVNIENSHTFFVMGGVTATSDYVATSSVIVAHDSIVGSNITLPKGAQFNKSVNMDGYYSLKTAVAYGFPVQLIKSNVNLSANANYQSKPGMYNYQDTKSDTYSFNAGLSVGSNISTDLDFTLSYNAGYNILESTSANSEDYNYYNHTAQFNLNWLFLKRMVFNNNLKQIYYKGLGNEYDQNYFLWNAGLGVKFMADNRAELRFKVYDILNQNKSLSRSITETYVETTNTNVLSQYAMLTFTYKLKTKGQRPGRPEGDRQGPPDDFRGREGQNGGTPPPPMM